MSLISYKEVCLFFLGYYIQRYVTYLKIIWKLYINFIFNNNRMHKIDESWNKAIFKSSDRSKL